MKKVLLLVICCLCMMGCRESISVLEIEAGTAKCKEVNSELYGIHWNIFDNLFVTCRNRVTYKF